MRHLARRRLLARDRDAHRVLQVARRDRRDARRHRRREERRLLVGRRRREDRLEVLGEAHVEHLVGLVEDDDAHAGRGAACLRLMWSSARPGVATTTSTPRFERADLDVHRRAAVDRHDAEARGLAVPVDRLGDLHRELARRHEHDAAGPAPRGAVSPRSAAASAARRPRSCRCRSPPGRARRGRSAAAGSPRAGSASALRSRGPRWRRRATA